MTKDAIIRKYALSQGTLFPGSIIGSVFFLILYFLVLGFVSILWESLTGTAVQTPTISFMSSYDKPTQGGYWSIVISITIVAYVLSVIVPQILGAGFGQWMLGVRYLDEQGQMAQRSRIFKKFSIEIGKFLLLALPGPTLGFALGPSADGASLFALLVGIVIVLRLSFGSDSSGRAYSYVKSGIVPVHKDRIEAFQTEVQSLEAQS
ncbi:MAG: hypothetical protein ACPGOY_05235 [Rhodospirillaceae bacterium]